MRLIHLKCNKLRQVFLPPDYNKLTLDRFNFNWQEADIKRESVLNNRRRSNRPGNSQANGPLNTYIAGECGQPPPKEQIGIYSG
jgi:hypothetical protein